MVFRGLPAGGGNAKQKAEHAAELAAALRQPPQPTGDVSESRHSVMSSNGYTGDVGDLVELLRTCARGFDYPDGQLTPTGQTIADAANLIVTLDSRFHDTVKERDASQGNADENYRRLQAAEQALRTAREALKPFAEFDNAGWTGPMLKGFTRKGQEALLKMSHFEAAYAALTGAGEEGE